MNPIKVVLVVTVVAGLGYGAWRGARYLATRRKEAATMATTMPVKARANELVTEAQGRLQPRSRQPGTDVALRAAQSGLDMTASVAVNLIQQAKDAEAQKAAVALAKIQHGLRVAEETGRASLEAAHAIEARMWGAAPTPAKAVASVARAVALPTPDNLAQAKVAVAALPNVAASLPRPPALPMPGVPQIPGFKLW